MKKIMEKRIEVMERDLNHGSSWYMDKTLELLSSVEYKDLKKVLDKVISIRPMATLSNIAEVVSKVNNDYELKVTINRLKKYRSNANKSLKTFLKNLKIKSFVTISFSSAVLSLIKNSDIDTVYLMESKPGNECDKAFNEYSKYSNVYIIPDSSICFFIQQSEAVVTGSDGVYKDYIVNKIGTQTLVECATNLKRPVYAICESYKAGIEPPSLDYMVSYTSFEKTLKIPLFEKASLKKIDYLVTNLGIFKNPRNSTIYEIRNDFIKNNVK
ncbi:MAG: hypothetical protein ACP5RS_05775 [Thermoplasmata archaeon]